jgi:hypothetical protein
LSALPAIASEVTMPGCAPGSGEKIAEYTARVYLNRKFSPQWPPTREQVREAILQQSRYLVNPTSMPSLVPSSVAPEIEILSEKDGTYPLELAVDRIQHPHVQLTHPYLKKALERGFAFKDDPARVIEYRARIKLAHCISASALKQSADLPASLWLPPDPHLAFWLVPSTQRRPLRYGQTFWVTSPCATHEVVEIIDPQQHWYVWNPLAHGKDQEGVPYDCRKILGSERLLSIAVKFQSPASDPNNGAQAGGDADADWISALASRPGPLTISAVFGIWRIQGAPLDTRKIA